MKVSQGHTLSLAVPIHTSRDTWTAGCTLLIIQHLIFYCAPYTSSVNVKVQRQHQKDDAIPVRFAECGGRGAPFDGRGWPFRGRPVVKGWPCDGKL